MAIARRVRPLAAAAAILAPASSPAPTRCSQHGGQRTLCFVRPPEGWIVLTRAAEPAERDFSDLTPNDADLAVTSSLITEKALEDIAELEARTRADEDEIFREASKAARDFISFVWLMLTVEEEHGIEPLDVDITGIVDATLAARQSAPARDSFLTVARVVRRRYAAAESPGRRRWPRTGTSIGSARALDGLAGTLTALIMFSPRRGEPADLAQPSYLLRFPQIVSELLDLSEAPRWQFRVTRLGATIDVAPTDILRDWLSGMPLPELAETHLGAATAASWRIEQMVDAVTSHFEHYLSWTVGALVELVNLQLSDFAFEGGRLCPELGGYIRYGVDDPRALILMTSGIRSRRLAHAVAVDVPEGRPATQDDLREWLAGMSIAEWRERYAASASEILDLLDFTRRRRRSLLKQLLESGAVTLELRDATLPASLRRLSVRPLHTAPEPAPLAVYTGDEPIATIASEDHADVATILDTGLAVGFAVDREAEPAELTITLPLGETG
jgi:hypothetical protein